MSQLTLRICSKDNNDRMIHEEYIINKINDKKEQLKSLNFLAEEFREEVKKLPRKELKKCKEICITTITTLGLIFLTGRNSVLAESPELIQTKEELATLPAEIIKIGSTLIGVGITLSTIMAILLMIVAGGERMIFRGRRRTSEWTSDIIKGYTQVMLAPIIIVTITLIMTLLFKDLDWFISPF